MVRLLLAVLAMVGPSCGNAQFFSSRQSPTEPAVLSTLDGLVNKARELAGGKVSDAAIGLTAGFATGMVCKKVQGLVVNSLVVGAGVVGGACLLGWAKPEDVARRAQGLAEDRSRGAGLCQGCRSSHGSP